MLRKTITSAIVATAITVGGGAALASATTPPDDPNDVEAIDNPVDDNDNDEGFDDWGLLGLLGLLGLGGLAGRRKAAVVLPDRETTRRV